MADRIEIETDRLHLRQWHPTDRQPFAALNADPRVMAFLPSQLTRADSDALADRCQSLIEQQGWGLWATELKTSHQFIGFVGLHQPSPQLPCSPCVEVGWRLAFDHWGQGLATEAARAALQVGFVDLNLAEIVSFTALGNRRSRAVMERLAMVESGTFDHPHLPEDSPLRPHYLYRLSRQTYLPSPLVVAPYKKGHPPPYPFIRTILGTLLLPPAMRWYTFWDDQGQFHRLPSVTTILNLTQPPQVRAQLTQALANHPLASTRKRQTSRQRGDRLDQWFKACCHQGKLLPLPPEIAPLGRQLKPYLTQLLALPQPLYPNQPVFNPDHGYAGTLDLVASHPLTPGLVLYELKSTGYKIWPQAIADAELQAAAYALAWPHQFPHLPITALATLHVTPYSLKENLILDPNAIAQLQGQFLKRLRGFGAAYRQVMG